MSNKKKQLNNYAKYSSLAVQMAVIITAGSLGGLKLDQWMANKFPYFTLSLSIISVALAVYFAIKDIIKFNK
ncbi:MAG: AtpZ/AtpI family protein [Bacteroidetes bacterium]|nr:AtpZ/AtpI family protein [Bacteroidota bacterium]